MRLIHIVHVAGSILRLFGVAFIAPILVTAFYREWADITGFILGGCVSAGLGQLLLVLTRDANDDLRQIEALAVVAGAWLTLAGLGAIPYLWVGFGVVDALFESMSGITTTGATILSDFNEPGRGVFFWRSMTQWLGGMGVITLVVAVLPRLTVGVRQLFSAETPGPAEEKIAPNIRKTAAYLWWFYTGLTSLAFIALSIAGMPFYDALLHAMTTLAAGGFSPNPESIMGYGNPAVEWVICGFMFLAGANFALQYRVLLGRPGLLLRDTEFKTYAGVAVLATVALSFFVWLAEGGSMQVRQAAFQTLSILTTTGYASVDFELWTDQAKVVLLALMFIGGCAGSAAGGPKVLRHMLIGRFNLTELRRILHTRAVLPVKLGGKVVPDHVMRGVLVFFLFYILTFAVTGAIVIAFGADVVTGVTAAVAALGNIGPGFGEVGPMANYGALHPVSKFVLTAAMWIGRLEVITVLALLRPEVWTAAHWVDQSNESRIQTGTV